MKTFQKLKLYNFCSSSSSWRVRIVLNLKKLKYEYVPINILKPEGEHLTAEYARINPMKQVPALEVDGRIITQSMAICQFLEDNFPEPHLLPKDSVEKAQVLAFCETINSGIQPLTNIGVLKKLDEQGVDSKKWAQYWLQNNFATLEKFLESSKGKYCFGDIITLGDAFLLPMIQGTVKRFHLDMKELPNINNIISELKELREFKEAHPLNQIDAYTLNQQKSSS